VIGWQVTGTVTTITLAVQLALLPQESVAVNVTLLVPSENDAGALLVTVAPLPQLSVAVTPFRNAAIAAFDAGTVFVQKDAVTTVIFVGQVMTGAVVSLTVIVCVQVALLPHGSTALYVRRTVYRFGQVLFVMTSPTQVTVGVPQVAEAVTDAVLAAGTLDAHCTVTAAGQVMLGAVVSTV